jgi:hypothetical protein
MKGIRPSVADPAVHHKAPRSWTSRGWRRRWLFSIQLSLEPLEPEVERDQGIDWSQEHPGARATESAGPNSQRREWGGAAD